MSTPTRTSPKAHTEISDRFIRSVCDRLEKNQRVRRALPQFDTRRMLAADPVDGRRGTILFTGASAGVKGFAQSAPFAMGKFAERGLSESMARELSPK